MSLVFLQLLLLLINMGKVSFELPVDNFERAIPFYKEVFGWNAEKLPFDSALIDTEGKAVDASNSAGVFTKRSDIVKAPVLIISVESINDTIKKVLSAGGSMITEKEKVGEFGYSAYGKDTEGTIYCLWEELI